MNHPAASHQVPHHAQMPQNVSQQRQVPNIQQQPQQQQQHQQQQVLPKAAQIQQLQNQVSTYNPKLALFFIEKGKLDKEWDDVEAQLQHIPQEDLRKDLEKYRKQRLSVKISLAEIKSATVRRLVNELVEQQTEKLWKINRTLQWKIASVETEWRVVKDRRDKGREIKRVSVLLETEPSGFPESQTVKPGAGGIQGVAKLPPSNVNQQQLGGGHIAQQNKVQHQGQAMGHGQQFEQQPRVQGHHHAHGNTNAPPPPPPPPYQAHANAHAGATPPPPPPPPGVVHPHQAVHPQVMHPQGGQMPGAYPTSIPGSRHGRPKLQVKNDQFARHNRPRRQGKRGDSSSDDDDEEDEKDWSTETGSVGSGRIMENKHDRNDRKLRGRGIKKDRTRRRSRSHVRATSNNRSPSLSRSSKHKSRPRSTSTRRRRSTKKHRHSNGTDYASDTKYYSSSSSHGSSRSRHGKHSRRHHSRDVSPSGVHFHTKRSSKAYKHHQMYQDGSEGSFRGSDTSSAPTSSDVLSTYRPSDRVFDERIRSHGHGRKHSHPHAYIGTSDPMRHREEYTRFVDARYNDYPQQSTFSTRRDSHVDDEWSHPPLQRLSGMQTHQNNPFNATQYPAESPRYSKPSPRRVATYAPETHPYSEARYAERPGNNFDMDEIKDAVYEVLQEKKRYVPQRQFSAQQQPRGNFRGGDYAEEDEWDTKRPALGGNRR